MVLCYNWFEVIKMKLQKLNKPNQLIALKTNEKITALQRKMYNVFLVVAQQKVKFNNPEMEIELDRTYQFEIDYKKAHRIAGAENKNLKYIEKELKKVMGIVATVRNKDNPDNWDSFSILPRVKKEDYKYKFQLQGLIVKALRDQNYFTPLHLMMLQSLSSQYAITLYELAIRYRDYKIPKMTVEEFREITNTTDKYKQFYNFRLRVLDPACKEITEKTNIDISYSTEKRGRRIAYINFETEVKEELSLTETKAEDSCYDEKELEGIFNQIVK